MQRLAAHSDATSPPADPLIRLEDVRKSFKLPDGQRFEAVRPTSLEVRRGDIFGLVGRSGAGKSTLLRLINLLERPDARRVIIGGRELTALGKRELRDARQAIGMIFQQFNLLQNASVFGNVASWVQDLAAARHSPEFLRTTETKFAGFVKTDYQQAARTTASK